MKLEINDIVWHPCSIDIMKYKIINKTQCETESETKITYIAKAEHEVGACGIVEVLLTIDRKGTLRFIGLNDDYEHDSGLQDFVEGIYYNNQIEARKSYYENQKTAIWSNMENKRRIYEESKKSYDTCCRILKEIQ